MHLSHSVSPMRNVNRTPMPGILQRNANRWTEELLNALIEARKSGRKVSPSRWRRYDHKEVRLALSRMYGGLCCYCESRIADVAYEHIEHRQPKKQFPQFTFSWDNLNLACPQCNGAKGELWDPVNEILDAVRDVPITEHLEYKVTKMAVYLNAATQRGAVTLIHTNLNRESLLQTRQKVFNEAYVTVTEIRRIELQEGNSPRATIAKNFLTELFQGEHGSLIKKVATEILNSAA